MNERGGGWVDNECPFLRHAQKLPTGFILHCELRPVKAATGVAASHRQDYHVQVATSSQYHLSFAVLPVLTQLSDEHAVRLAAQALENSDMSTHLFSNKLANKLAHSNSCVG